MFLAFAANGCVPSFAGKERNTPIIHSRHPLEPPPRSVRMWATEEKRIGIEILRYWYTVVRTLHRSRRFRFFCALVFSIATSRPIVPKTHRCTECRFVRWAMLPPRAVLVPRYRGRSPTDRPTRNVYKKIKTERLGSLPVSVTPSSSFPNSCVCKASFSVGVASPLPVTMRPPPPPS